MCRSSWIVGCFGIVSIGLSAARLSGVETTVQNDSLAPGSLGTIQAGFDPGESAAAWLTSPCNGDIVAVQVFWRSLTGGTGVSLEESIIIYAAGTFPVPGAVLETLEGPVMTDGVFNEFRYLDDQQTIPLMIPVTSGQRFVVSFTFLNDPDPGNGPSVVNDTGCQPNKNGLFANPGIWFNSCSLGVSGDWAIRAVVDCNPTQACCFLPSSCVNLTALNCAIADGFPQGPGTSCATVECFPRGACCQPDGTCDDDVAQADCTTGGGTFQGDDSLCANVTCPQPLGACCLSNGNCLELTEDDCEQIPNTFWAGALTDCTDTDMNSTADACEAECATPAECDDSDACTTDTCELGHCMNTPLDRPYGDIFPAGGDGVIDVDDILCSFAGFSNLADCPDAEIAPCGGNLKMDVDDLLAELDAFSGMFLCPDPC